MNYEPGRMKELIEDCLTGYAGERKGEGRKAQGAGWIGDCGLRTVDCGFGIYKR